MAASVTDKQYSQGIPKDKVLPPLIYGHLSESRFSTWRPSVVQISFSQQLCHYCLVLMSGFALINFFVRNGGTQRYTLYFFAYSKWKILSFSTIKIICLPGVDFSKSQNNKFSMGREGTTLLHLPSVVLMPLHEERAPLTSYRIWEHDTDVLSSALVFTCKLSPVTQHSNSSFFKALVNLQAPGTCRSM